MTLKFVNNVSKKEYEYSVTDLNDSKLYYHFENFVLDDGMDDGEYNYFLFDNDDNLVAQGLVQIGDYVPEHTIYDNNDVKYKQYNG